MANKPLETGTIPGYYTTSQAAKKTRIPLVILRWLVETENIPRPRFGHRKVFDEAALAATVAVFRSKDPSGRFLSHPNRKNGNRRGPVAPAERQAG